MFSKPCEYGLRAIIYLAKYTDKNNKTGIAPVASAIDSPSAYTAKVLQKLAKNKIIESTKGPNGGFYFSEEKKETQLIDIVRVFDGEKLFESCAMGLKTCSDQSPCPLHEDFLKVRNKLIDVLEKNTIEQIITENKEHLILKR